MQNDPHGFFPYLHVGASGEHAEDIHSKIVEDVLMLRAEGVNSVQDNDLDVVVRFFLHELDECLGRGCKSVRRGCQEGSEDRIPFTATGFCARVVRIVAASYLTDDDAALRSSKMHRRYLGCRTDVFNIVFPGME